MIETKRNKERSGHSRCKVVIVIVVNRIVIVMQYWSVYYYYLKWEEGDYYSIIIYTALQADR